MRKVIPEEIVKKLVEYLGLKQYFQDEKGWWIVVEGRRNWDGSGAWRAKHISCWKDILEAWGIQI